MSQRGLRQRTGHKTIKLKMPRDNEPPSARTLRRKAEKLERKKRKPS
jgi:hypothetical protein